MSAQDTVLVVGAGPAGLSAAATIASMGKKAVIVEKEDILGPLSNICESVQLSSASPPFLPSLSPHSKALAGPQTYTSSR